MAAMEMQTIEALYPVTFRKEDAKILGDHLKHRHSVELVGMKRVGISNFLRFFLHNKKVIPTYINDRQKHLFIPVDLHDLIEQELFPFWVLTFKRLLDAVEHSKLSPKIKEELNTLFLNSVQLQDHFLTIESLKKSLNLIIQEGFLPTVFFIRFDRLQEAATYQFYLNLQGLIDATNKKLCYVFTSFRPLDQIAESAFPRQSLAAFSEIMYLCPAEKKDMRIIFDSFQTRYQLDISDKLANQMLELSGGHVQYLHILFLLLRDQPSISQNFTLEEIISDERASYMFDELWESLTNDEQATLKKIVSQQKITKDDREHSKYIWLTGFVNKKNTFLSPLFEFFLNAYDEVPEKKAKTSETADFTKKEHLLYSVLLENLDMLCERDQIALQVWPELESEGVSDWTIDRLVARVRQKMKKQNSEYSIMTIKTRGYKLVKG